MIVLLHFSVPPSCSLGLKMITETSRNGEQREPALRPPCVRSFPFASHFITSAKPTVQMSLSPFCRPTYRAWARPDDSVRTPCWTTTDRGSLHPDLRRRQDKIPLRPSRAIPAPQEPLVSWTGLSSRTVPVLPEHCFVFPLNASWPCVVLGRVFP